MHSTTTPWTVPFTLHSILHSSCILDSRTFMTMCSHKQLLLEHMNRNLCLNCLRDCTGCLHLFIYLLRAHVYSNKAGHSIWFFAMKMKLDGKPKTAFTFSVVGGDPVHLSQVKPVHFWYLFFSVLYLNTRACISLATHSMQCIQLYDRGIFSISLKGEITLLKPLYLW